MTTFEDIILLWKTLGCDQICKLIEISEDIPLVVTFMNRYENIVQKTFEHVARKAMMILQYQIRHPHIPHNNLEFARKAQRIDLLLTRYFRRMQAVIEPEQLLRKHTISSESIVYDQEEKNISVTLE